MEAPAPAQPSRDTGLPPGVEVGPLGPRLLGYLIDSSLPAVVGGLFALLAPTLTGGSRTAVIVVGLLLVLLWGVLEWYLLAVRAASLGMRALRLQLVGFYDGRPLGWGRVLLRSVLLRLIAATGIGLVVMLVLLVLHPRRQGWHDLATSGVVIKQRVLAPRPTVVARADTEVPAGQGPFGHTSAGEPDVRQPSPAGTEGSAGYPASPSPVRHAADYPPGPSSAPSAGSYPPGDAKPGHAGPAYAGPPQTYPPSTGRPYPDAAPPAYSHGEQHPGDVSQAYPSTPPPSYPPQPYPTTPAQSFPPAGYPPLYPPLQPPSAPPYPPVGANWPPQSTAPAGADWETPPAPAPMLGVSGPASAASAGSVVPSSAGSPAESAAARTPPAPVIDPTGRWEVVLDDGRRIPVQGLIMLGRNPQPHPGEEEAHLVKISDDTRTVSKSHLAVGRDGTGVYVTDRGSTNGSTVTTTAGVSTRCPVGERVYVATGTIVSMGDHWLEVRRTGD